MSAAVMEALQPARSASVGRRTSTITASTGAAMPNTADEIIEDRRKYPDGTVQVRKYLKGRFLGKGGFAKCYMFTSLSKNKVLAGKVVLKSSLMKERAKQKLLAEIKIHRDMCHTSIVRFESFFEDKTAVYILLELCANNTMMELVKQRRRLTEPEAAYYMLQLIDATRYLHAHNVIHRDLKLGNLFLSRDMKIKLGDFGLAAKLDTPTDRRRTICGTPNYIAPEILNKRPGGHSFEVDIWSLGVILYTMVVGKPPYETQDIETTYKRIRSNTYSFPDTAPVSETVKHLIGSILQLEPEARPSLESIANHPFFTGAGVMIPTSVPVTSLNAVPTFHRDDLASGSRLVSDMLSRPIGDLRSHAIKPVSPSENAAPESVDIPHAASAQPMVKSHTSVPTGREAAISSAARKPFTVTDAVPNLVRADSNPEPKPATTVVSASVSAAAHRRSHSVFPSSHGSRAVTPTAPVNEAIVGEETRPIVIPPLHMAPTSVPSGGGPITVDIIPSGVSTRSRTAMSARPPASENSTAVMPPPSLTARPATSSSAVSVSRGRSRSPRRDSGGSDRLAFAPVAPVVDTVTVPAFVDVPSKRTSHSPAFTDRETDVLHAMHDALARTIDMKPIETVAVSTPSGAASVGPSLWVTSWVDYTSKYGLGYMLSNGSVGVYFNDSTKIILASDGVHGEYIDRSVPTADGRSPVKLDTPRTVFTMTDYPEDLNKKITLLKHFRGYLTEQYRTQSNKCEEEVAAMAAGSPTVNIPFVKKWVRTRHAILFRMSNRVVQINFFDHTAIVLSSDSHRMTYVGKDGARSHHGLASIMTDNRPDIAKRLRYTKDILSQLITGGKQ